MMSQQGKKGSYSLTTFVGISLGNECSGCKSFSKTELSQVFAFYPFFPSKYQNQRQNWEDLSYND
jgi:hypothetical protein